jgi:very-short-patch-repair endonuclease
MDDQYTRRSNTAGSRHGIARSRQLRSRETDAERRIWLALRDRRLDGFKFRRQQSFGPYIVDFFCAEKYLIIELDGGQHMANAGQDAERTRYLADRGYRVLRFWDNDVLSNTAGVLESILKELGTPRTNPLPQGERER